MLSLGTRATIAVAVSLGILVVSCTTTPPCMSVNIGDRFEITVVDTYDVGTTRYDAGAPDACGFGFDFAKGQQLVATAVANLDDKIDDCNVAGVRIDPFNSWTWTFDASMSGGTSTDLLVGTYAASNGTCTGNTTISIGVDSGANAFAPYVPGQVPHVIMRRTFFHGSGAGCPSLCNGYFIVSIKKV